MKKMITLYALIIIGLWAVISLTMFLWHAYRGRQVAKATIKYERIDATGPRIVLAGDSVMFGVGATKPENSIAGLFGRDFPTASITNVGVSGAETDGLVEQLKSIQGQQFDLVVIIIGANDVFHFTNLKKSLVNLDQALTLAKKLSDQVIFMPEGNLSNAPLLPRLASLVLTPRSREFRSGAISLAEKNQVVYIDVFRERADDHWRKDVKKYYAADFFHPADAGYLDWYNAITSEVKL